MSLNFYDTESWELKASRNGLWLIGMAISPDSKLLAIGTGPGEEMSLHDPKYVELYALESGETIRRIAHERTTSEIVGLAFAPDGQSLAVGRRNGSLKLYDLAGEVIQVFAEGNFPAHRGSVALIEFSPAGDWLLSGDIKKEPEAKAWKVATGEKIAHIRMSSDQIDAIQGLDISPNGRYVALSSMRKAALLETEEWKTLWAVERAKGGFAFITFSPEGDQFAYVEYPHRAGAEDPQKIRICRIDSIP
jgi:WD40 repeat protein